MLDKLRSVRTALRIVKARLPRAPYASFFAVVLLVPLVGDEVAAFPTHVAPVDGHSSSVALTNTPDAAPAFGISLDDLAPGLAPAPSPIVVAPAPAAVPVNVVPAPAPVPVNAVPAPSRAVPAPPRAALLPPAPTAVPQVAQPCPADWICYARVGLAGPIVPYTDCSGGSDIGTAIRAFTCLSPTYLLGHAYTQFGKITQWRAGDVVFAYGRPYTVTGATTQSSCAPPVLPLAPLSLQTSLSPNACGLVLVVQAR